VIAAILQQLQQLYAELPSVKCHACGQCCVSPTCTLVEFIYLMRGMKECFSSDELRTLLAAPPVLSPTCEGNLLCRFLKDNRCAVHPARTGACRLFGTSASRDRGVADLVVCAHGIEDENRTDPAAMQVWLDRLMDLNRAIYAVGTDPYFLFGLNLESWTDIYFDDSLNVDIFGDISKAMHEAVDLSAYASTYVARTGIKEKIDKISILSVMTGMGDADTLRELVTSIRDGYPFTGTYFRDESEVYLREIEKARERTDG
jgi:hypothetical protein